MENNDPKKGVIMLSHEDMVRFTKILETSGERIRKNLRNTIPFSYGFLVDRLKILVKKAFTKEQLEDESLYDNHMFEEFIELMQARGKSREEVYWMVDQVFAKPKGEVRQEVAGVFNTLLAFCHFHQIDPIGVANEDLDKVEENLEEFIKKQNQKPTYSPEPDEDKLYYGDEAFALVKEKGLKPWYGGNFIPLDLWPGRQVLHRNGRMCDLDPTVRYRWGHNSSDPGMEIIGYPTRDM